MSIRKIELSDLNSIVEMTAQNFIDSWSFDMLKSSYQSDGFFGLIDEENGDVLSVCAFGGVLDERELYFVVTKQSARGKGVAKQLLSLALDNLKDSGINKIFLEVRESNFCAISLYNSLGFVKIAERKNYYGTETAIIMQKEF